MAYANALGEVSFAHATPYVNGVLDEQQIEALRALNPYAQDCWALYECITGHGKRHSLSNRPGSNYRTITLGEIFEIDEPAHVERDAAQWFIPHNHNGHLGRERETAAAKGSYCCAVTDIDDNGEELALVCEKVNDIIGADTAVKIYSTGSALPNAPRWRIVVPFQRKMPYTEWVLVQGYLAEKLGGDIAMLGAAQFSYLPNVPDKTEKKGVELVTRDPDGKPLFWKTYKRHGEGLDVAAWKPRLSEWKREQDEQAARQANPSKPAPDNEADGGGAVSSLIDQFNADNDIAAMLQHCGYEQDPRNGNDWRSPYQTSNSYATAIMPGGRWVSLSGSDAAAGLGKPSQDGRCVSGDAFDLHVHFGHGGNRDAAMKDLAKKYGKPQRKGGKKQPPAPALTELDLAQRLAHEVKGRLRWTHGLDWLVPENGRWVLDETQTRHREAKRLCKEVADSLENPNRAARIASNSTVNALVSLLRSESEIVTPLNAWDHDPMILNTPSGAIDLRTGQAVPAGGLYRQVTAVAPERMATPIWDRFLQQVFLEDAATIEFVQRLAGYCFTGSTQEQKIFFLYGTGSNGKSVLLNVLREIAGCYGLTFEAEGLMQTKHEPHPEMFAKLVGKRMAVSNELPQNGRWHEARVKALTGSDKISARFMKKDSFEFTPNHTHLVSANFRPRLSGDDAAMARRMVLVPFEAKFEGKTKDPQLPEKLRAEYPGILQWVIDGAGKWHADGLGVPEKTAAASAEYMEDMNDLQSWLDECCTVAPNVQTPSSILYKDFRDWKESRGEACPAIGTFKDRLQRVEGIMFKKTKTANIWIGVGRKAGVFS